MKYTEEQITAVNLSNNDKSKDLKIEAYAGSGKTTTLKAISEDRSDTGLYLAFNRAIKDEALARFPSRVNCKTGHGLAYGTTGRLYADRLKTRLTPKVLIDAYSLQQQDNITPYGVGVLLLHTINRYCQSGDEKFSKHHFPEVVIDKPEMADYFYSCLKRIWSDMNNVQSKLPVTHDFYLKKWSLGNPRLACDYILFDEAQDANGVILSVVQRQKAQKIYVGDRHQQIYSWRGAINAMQSIETDNVCNITQSFRFGNKIAEAANLVLSKVSEEKISISGFGDDSTLEEVETPNAYIFRTNAALIGTLVELVNRDNQPSVFVVGGTRELVLLLEGAEELRNGKRSYLPDLVNFDTWEDLCEFADSEVGSDLKPLVNIVMGANLWKVKEALRKCSYTKEEFADITLTTAHKSKGREWDTVKLANDFLYSDCLKKGYEPSEEQYNLLYVALTRAKKTLDVTECNAYTVLLQEEKE